MIIFGQAPLGEGGEGWGWWVGAGREKGVFYFCLFLFLPSTVRYHPCKQTELQGDIHKELILKDGAGRTSLGRLTLSELSRSGQCVNYDIFVRSPTVTP